MSDRLLPDELASARRTPLFDPESLPPALVRSHRTAVWAELRVQTGSVRYIDLEGESPRNERLEAGDSGVVAPGVQHRIEPSTNAVFYIQYFREPDAPLIPATEPEVSSNLSRHANTHAVVGHGRSHQLGDLSPAEFLADIEVAVTDRTPSPFEAEGQAVPRGRFSSGSGG